MQVARLTGRICRHCSEATLSCNAGSSRSLSIYTRRRQKRNMSAQAAALPLQSMETYINYQAPPLGYTNIDWEEQGAEVAEQKVQKIFDGLIDRKGKGKAESGKQVEPTTSNRHVFSRNDQFRSSPDNSEFSHLFVPGTASLSLDRLTKHYKELENYNISYQLRLIAWIIDLTNASTNDVHSKNRRWRVTVYMHARSATKYNIQSTPGTMPNSIDTLCAELIKTELKGVFSDGDLWLLKKLTFQALRRNGFRTVQAVESILKDDDTFTAFDQLPDSLKFFLAMKECFFIAQAKRGEWTEVWQHKDEILALLKRQKDLNQLFFRNKADDWRMDVVLIKSLNARCAHHAVQKGGLSREVPMDLASDKYYMKHILLLQEKVKDIYGEITDKWLTNLILGLSRGVESQSDLRHLSMIDYFDRLALTNLAQRLFKERCQGRDKPSAELLDTMLALEQSWERHCRAHKGMRGKIRMTEQAEKHHENVKAILQLLSKYHHRAASATVLAPVETRRQVMEDLRGKAMAAQMSIKFLLSRNDLANGLQRLKDSLDIVRPDEDYFHLTGSRFMPSVQSQQATTAKSTMRSRRLTRGSFICIALGINRSRSHDKAKYIPAFVQLIKDSIERGIWDPWPLKKDATRKGRRFLNFKPHYVDAAADLSVLCNKLLAMCRPVLPVHRDSVVPGYTVIDSSLAPTYYKVLESIALLHKTMERRMELLQEKGLVNLIENLTRSKHTLRDIFVNRGTSAAQCIWAALSNPTEGKLIASRLKFLFEEIFVPLGLPGKGWTSAGLALQQEWPPHANVPSLREEVWTLFDKAYQKRLEMRSFGGGPLVLSPEEGNPNQIETKAMRRNHKRRLRVKERKGLARERRTSRALYDRSRR